jgi:hypothetical protein
LAKKAKNRLLILIYQRFGKEILEVFLGLLTVVASSVVLSGLTLLVLGVFFFAAIVFVIPFFIFC